MAPNRDIDPNARLGLGKYGPFAQLGAVGFVFCAVTIAGDYVLSTAKNLQTEVLTIFREMRKEDLAERSADRERTLKLAEAMARLAETQERQAVVMQQQASSLERVAASLERLKVNRPAIGKKDENHPDFETAPMPRGCP